MCIRDRFGGASLIIGPVLREEGFGQDPSCRMYAGGLGNQEIGVVTAEIDLSLAVRTIYQNNPITGEPDYRPELYRKWQEKESRIEAVSYTHLDVYKRQVVYTSDS